MTRFEQAVRQLLLSALLLAWAAVCAAAPAERRVTEISYVGLGAVTPRDLESALQFAPGDRFRESLVQSTQQAIAEYYAKRGFYHAAVDVRAKAISEDRVSLKVHVEEGAPCLLSSVWIDDPPGFKSKHVMERFKSRMTDMFRMAPGDRYDEQVLADRLRELRDWLIAEDFILANTDKVRLKFNADHTGVEVVLAVDYGDRVTFGFRGYSVFTQGDFNDLIAQVRTTGLGKDYVGVIQRRLLDEYQSRGYSNAKIETRLGELPLSRHVTFVIHEGTRTELEEVRWEGLTESNTATAREVFENGAPRLIQRGFFVEKDIEKATLLVLEDLKSRGYLSSKLISRSVQPVKAPSGVSRVRVVIQVAEGEQTLVGRIELAGVGYFTPEKIYSTLNLAEEKPFNPFALEEGLQRLRTLYTTEGFLDFRVTTAEDDIVTFSENNRIASIRLSVTEGPRVRVGRIRIQGLEKTKEFVVQRELTVHEDDWWLGASMQETEVNVRKLGLFSDVKLSSAPSERGTGYRDLIVDLKEAEPGAFEIGPGYRSDLGVRGFSRVSYNNILGRNWIGSLGAEANRRMNSDYQFIEYSLDSSFVEPRFFGTRNLFTIGLSTQKQRFPPDFNAVSTTFVTGFERKLFPAVTAKLLYKLERIRQFDVYLNGQYSAIDNQSMLIGSIVPSLTIDTRDNPFTATSGWLIHGELEYAQPQFSDQSIANTNAPAYQKWTGSIHKYTALPKGIVWSNVFSAGFERSDVAGRVIPLIKLFRLGGYNTIRGFQEDSINVDTIGVAGTLTLLNLRTQFDLPLVGDLKFAPFVDAGNLFIDTLRNNPFFRAGGGVGLHYMTPVGPINLDWGHKLNPIGGESEDQIHFSVGLI